MGKGHQVMDAGWDGLPCQIGTSVASVAVNGGKLNKKGLGKVPKPLLSSLVLMTASPKLCLFF